MVDRDWFLGALEVLAAGLVVYGGIAIIKLSGEMGLWDVVVRALGGGQ